MVYQPMLELLGYLRANGFKTFIVSGGGIEFMRPWTEAVYGIPPHQVVGSSIKAEFDYNDGNPVIRKLPELDFIDDKAGKPVGIYKYIGKKPIFASGNSDGDLQMLQYTASNPKAAFMLYLHHTDGDREWAYDRESHVGRLDRGRGCLVIHYRLLAPFRGKVFSHHQGRDDHHVKLPPQSDQDCGFFGQRNHRRDVPIANGHQGNICKIKEVLVKGGPIRIQAVK